MLNENLICEMIDFDAGDPKRIQHFLKVYEFAHLIGVSENLDPKTMKILEAAAILHDIGIHPAEEKYGSCGGKLQEREGPKYAEIILEKYPEFSDEERERICYLIGHHHTYSEVDGLDYRILLEADFLVNAFEDNLNSESIRTFRDKVFVTKTGTELLNKIFGI